MKILPAVFLSFLFAFSITAAPEKFTAAQYDPFVGDWLPKNPGDYVAQVIGTGSNSYQVNMLAAFDDEIAAQPVAVLRGSHADEKNPVELKGEGWTGWLRPDCCGSPRLEITNVQTAETVQLNQYMRANARLRAKAPAGAVALFADLARDGVFETAPGSKPLAAKEKFNNARIHLEFRMLGEKSAGALRLGERPALGLFASYGYYDKPACGTLLTSDPISPWARAERPLLEWQALDIELTTGRMTAVLNGIKIHDNIELDSTERTDTGDQASQLWPLVLEQCGGPVQFRNIWVQAL